jgi:apolipoprotein N-acyltransferase
MELIRYHFPVGGLEWGAAGYAMSDNLVTRLPAAAVGTSGLTVLVVLIAGLLASTLTRRWDHRLLWSLVIVVAALVATVPSTLGYEDAPDLRVAIVQGSTPCPFEHCPPNERLRTYEQHLELTRTIPPGSVDLVVWSEGSTGSTNADPVLNDDIGQAIADEAVRIGAAMLIGGDRVVSDSEWINANVYFNDEGEILGEYRKQHPVPFGEYVPLRPLFEWIPALDRVPRDMIPGDGPVVFEETVGSVISFEGGFSRYALETRRAGATVIVVATNEASYGPEAPTSDQFIGMTRMRAVELGVPVVHAAVTGKSTTTDRFGNFELTTALGTQEIFQAGYGGSNSTIYTVTGDLFMYLVAITGILAWSKTSSLVVSPSKKTQED